MRIFTALFLGVFALTACFTKPASAEINFYLVCDKMSRLVESLDNIVDVRQSLERDESVLASGCRWSTLSAYSFELYPDWWYHADANNLFFDVDRIKLLVNGHVTEWYTMSRTSIIDEFEARPNFLMRLCQRVEGRLGCWTNRGRVFSLDPPWSDDGS